MNYVMRALSWCWYWISMQKKDMTETCNMLVHFRVVRKTKCANVLLCLSCMHTAQVALLPASNLLEPFTFGEGGVWQWELLCLFLVRWRMTFKPTSDNSAPNDQVADWLVLMEDLRSSGTHTHGAHCKHWKGGNRCSSSYWWKNQITSAKALKTGGFFFLSFFQLLSSLPQKKKQNSRV